MRATDRGGLARRLIVLALALALPLVALANISPARAASDLLPDLGMARLTDLKLERTPDGRKLLRFSSIIVNVGDGPIEVHGQRPDSHWTLHDPRHRMLLSLFFS